MTRAAIYFLKLLAIAMIAAWLADQNSPVSMVWSDYVIETTLGVLGAFVFISLILSIFLYRLSIKLVNAPKILKNHHHDNNRKKGYRALNSGLMALAARDVKTARQEAHRVARYLENDPLADFLIAQTLLFNGEEKDAGAHFEKMAQKSSTSFWGVRGLLLQAMNKNDTEHSLVLAARLYDLYPKSHWAMSTLFEIQIKAEKWREAEKLLIKMIRLDVISTALGQHHHAALLIGLSQQEEQNNRLSPAISRAKQALEFLPNFVPATLRLIHLYQKTGKNRKASLTIEKYWKYAPHPDLVSAWKTVKTPDSEDQLKWIKKLLQIGKETASAHLAVAETALDIKLWGEARHHLTVAIALAETSEDPFAHAVLRRVYQSFARLESEEHNNSAAEKRWLLKAVSAPFSPVWLCQNCNTHHTGWYILCPQCQVFDEIVWSEPDVSHHHGTPLLEQAVA